MLAEEDDRLQGCAKPLGVVVMLVVLGYGLLYAVARLTVCAWASGLH